MTAESAYRGRFAPSPTGPLHLGSLVAALASWLHARAAGGEWLVRVEDIDPPREVAGAAARQLATLAAFGLDPDAPPLWQSTRADAYRQALQRLAARNLTYPCRCSRADLAPFGGIHPSRCVATDAERAPAIRLAVGDAVIAFQDAVQGPCRQVLADAVGDFVIGRSDGLAAYQLAVVVDDATQGITDVVRGADLLDSTPRQIHLQRLLGLPTPRYLHLPLVLDASGAKLSKSLAALPLDDNDPLPALRHAYAVLGQPLQRLPTSGNVSAWLRAAVAHFDPAAIPRTARSAFAHQ